MLHNEQVHACKFVRTPFRSVRWQVKAVFLFLFYFYPCVRCRQKSNLQLQSTPNSPGVWVQVFIIQYKFNGDAQIEIWNFPSQFSMCNVHCPFSISFIQYDYQHDIYSIRKSIYQSGRQLWFTFNYFNWTSKINEIFNFTVQQTNDEWIARLPFARRFCDIFVRNRGRVSGTGEMGQRWNNTDDHLRDDRIACLFWGM